MVLSWGKIAVTIKGFSFSPMGEGGVRGGKKRRGNKLAKWGPNGLVVDTPIVIRKECKKPHDGKGEKKKNA